MDGWACCSINFWRRLAEGCSFPRSPVNNVELKSPAKAAGAAEGRSTQHYWALNILLMLRSTLVIIVEHSAQFVATADAAHLEEARRRLDQFVLDALMIAPLAIIVDEGRDGGPQLLLA